MTATTAADMIATIDHELDHIYVCGGEHANQQLDSIHRMQVATTNLAGMVEDLQDIADRHAGDDAQAAWDAQHPWRALGRDVADGIPGACFFVVLVTVAAWLAVRDGVDLTSGNIRTIGCAVAAIGVFTKSATIIARLIPRRRETLAADVKATAELAPGEMSVDEMEALYQVNVKPSTSGNGV